MSESTAMIRLAAVRPAVTSATSQLSGPLERARLIESILSSDAAATSNPTRPTFPVARRFLPVAAAAAVVFVGAAAVVDESPPSAPRTSIPAVPSGESGAATAERIELALISHHGSVVRMDSDYGNGVLWEAWYDAAEGRWRSLSRDHDGRPLYEHEITTSEGQISAVVANHSERTWWTYTGPGERGGAPHPTPEEIRAHLAEGRLEEVGRSADEIHLRSRPQDKSAESKVIVMVGELWVDATTYLPRRSSFSGAGTTGSTTYTWLPRSEANMAATRLSVPSGYRQLDEPPAR